MDTINKNQPIKEQFEKLGIAYPHLKSNKKYGLRGSSLLDDDTEEGCLKKYLAYLENNNVIRYI
jgi:hypothetical protein